jgi:hypothetical protein
LSIEKDLREKAEPRLKKVQMSIDAAFASKEQSAKDTLEWIKALSKIADETHNMIETRFDNASVKGYMLQLSRILAFQTKLQEQLANMTLDNIRELKQTNYSMASISVEIIIEMATIVSELSPQFDSSSQMMKDRLTAFEKEIQHIKESKDQITLQIASEYDEALKELTKYIEARKKAEKSYNI